MNTDSELIQFSGRVIEKFGGAVEHSGDGLLTVLSPDLASRLSLPEEARIGGQDQPLMYGSPLLDRLVGLTMAEIPVVYGRIVIPYLKKEGFAHVYEKEVVLADVQARYSGHAVITNCVLILHCHYIALSDERKEGLIKVSVNEVSGGIIDDFESKLDQFEREFYHSNKIPPQFGEDIDRAVSVVLTAARGKISGELVEFISSMRRRLQRDVGNTREYFQAVRKEMIESLSQHSLNESQRGDRQAKIDEIPQEIERKIDDLRRKYSIDTTLIPAAGQRYLLDSVRLMVDLRCGKAVRQLNLTWNPVSYRLEPIPCESCGRSSLRFHGRVEGMEIRLVCPDCRKKTK